MADIFLSYARETQAQARRLALALNRTGGPSGGTGVFRMAENFTVSIQKELDDARCIAVLWSKASIASSFVLDEATGRARWPAGSPANRKGQTATRIPPVAGPPTLPTGHGETPHDEFDRLLDFDHHPRETAPVCRTGPRGTARQRCGAQGTACQRRGERGAAANREADVYVCYSHLDNIELIEGRRGWVHNFTRALDIRLSQLLGRSAAVWMNPKLAGADSLTEKEFDVIRHAACLVAVVSPPAGAIEVGAPRTGRIRARGRRTGRHAGWQPFACLQGPQDAGLAGHAAGRIADPAWIRVLRDRTR